MASVKRKSAAKRKKDTVENEEEAQEEDISILGQSVPVGIRGVVDLARAVHVGTSEFQDLISHECSLIYECKVCKNLFRSVANFITHKRKYCMQRYQCFTRGFSDDKMRDLGPSAEPNVEPQVVTERPPQKKNGFRKAKILPSLCQEVPLSPPQRLGSQLLTDPENDFNMKETVRCRLESMQQTGKAVFQTLLHPTAVIANSIQLEINDLESGLKDREAVVLEDGRAVFQTEKFACNRCDASFPSARVLERHQKIYHVPRMCYPCPICKTFLISPWAVYKHLKKNHLKSDEQLRRLRPQVLASATKRELHNVRQNTPDASAVAPIPDPLEEERKWMANYEGGLHCVICRKKFTRRAALNVHKCVVPLVKPQKFNCDNCGRKFARRSLLNAHSKNCSLTAVQPVTCDKCGHKFVQRDLLTAHSETCIVVEPKALKESVICEKCGQELAPLGLLRVHAEHCSAVEAPVTCEKCGRKFSGSILLKAHSITCPVTSVESSESSVEQLKSKETFTCEKCDRKYPSCIDLSAHTLTCSGVIDVGNEQPISPSLEKVPSREHENKTSRCSEITSDLVRENSNNRTLRQLLSQTLSKETVVCSNCEKTFSDCSLLKIHADSCVGETLTNKELLPVLARRTVTNGKPKRRTIRRPEPLSSMTKSQPSPTPPMNLQPSAELISPTLSLATNSELLRGLVQSSSCPSANVVVEEVVSRRASGNPEKRTTQLEETSSSLTQRLLSSVHPPTLSVAPIMCTKCGLKFSDCATLRLHTDACPRGKKNRSSAGRFCFSCKRWFNQISNFERHLKKCAKHTKPPPLTPSKLVVTPPQSHTTVERVSPSGIVVRRDYSKSPVSPNKCRCPLSCKYHLTGKLESVVRKLTHTQNAAPIDITVSKPSKDVGVRTSKRLASLESDELSGPGSPASCDLIGRLSPMMENASISSDFGSLKYLEVMPFTDDTEKESPDSGVFLENGSVDTGIPVIILDGSSTSSKSEDIMISSITTTVDGQSEDSPAGPLLNFELFVDEDSRSSVFSLQNGHLDIEDDMVILDDLLSGESYSFKGFESEDDNICEKMELLVNRQIKVVKILEN